MEYRVLTKLFVAILLVMCLLFFTAVQCMFSKPQEVSKKDKIAFINANINELEIVNADGTGRKLLVGIDTAGEIKDFAVSPDGSKIAFLSARGLEVINIEGTKRKLLVEYRCDENSYGDCFYTNPVFSPDGNMIVFGASKGRIIISALDGSWIKVFEVVKDTPYSIPAWFRWTPDARKVFFRLGDSNLLPGDSLYFLDLTTGKIEKVFNNVSPIDADYNYDISNTGKIVFVKVDEEGKPFSKEYRRRVWLIVCYQTGKNERQIFGPVGALRKDSYEFSKREYEKLKKLFFGSNTDLGDFYFSSEEDIYCPRWSPDGKKIAFLYKKLDKKKILSALSTDEVLKTVLVVIDSDGKNYKELLSMPSGGFGEFVWSPDGKKIVYSSYGDLWIIDTNGQSKPKKLLERGVKPSWFFTTHLQTEDKQKEIKPSMEIIPSITVRMLLKSFKEIYPSRVQIENKQKKAIPSVEAIPPVTINEKWFKKKTKLLKINIRIPVIVGLKDKRLQARLNSKFEKIASEWIADAEKEVTDYVAKWAKNPKTYASPYDNPYLLDADFEVHYNRNGLLSILIEVESGYAAGCPGYEIKAFNIDLKTGRELLIKDFYRDPKDWETLVKRAIYTQFKQIIFGSKLNEFYVTYGKLIQEDLNKAFDINFNSRRKGIKSSLSFYIANDDSIVIFSNQWGYGLAQILMFQVPISKKLNEVEASGEAI